MHKSSGIGTYIRNIVPMLIEMLPDIKLTLLSNNNSCLNISVNCLDRVKYIPLSASIYSIKEQWQLLRSITKDCDLFWSPHYNIPVFCKSPLLVTIHDVAHLALPEFYTNNLLKKFYAGFMFRRIKSKANHIITDSNFSKGEIVKHTGIEESRISTIHIGINDNWFRIADSESPFPEKYILYVGNVKPHKNLPRLILAFKSIMNSIDHHLIIVGEKSNFITADPFTIQIAEDLKDKVHFTGYVSNELLKRYVKHAKALICPSLYEGFGLPPLEAMAAGIPAIVSDIPAHREMLHDAPEYFDPTSEESISSNILKVLSDNKLRNFLIEKGLNQTMKYRWHETAAKTAMIINNLIYH